MTRRELSYRFRALWFALAFVFCTTMPQPTTEGKLVVAGMLTLASLAGCIVYSFKLAILLDKEEREGRAR